MKRRTPVFILPCGKKIYLEPGNKNRPQPRLYFRENNKVVWWHVYLAETRIRPLTRGEVVHHIDGNPLNNAVSNLQIVTRAEHVRIHAPVKGYKFTTEQRKRLSDSHKGQKAWNTGMRGFKHSAEAKANMSRAQTGRKITWGDRISASKTKATKAQLIQFIQGRPHCSAADIKQAFKLKSNAVIHKHGGLRRLKKEATT